MKVFRTTFIFLFLAANVFSQDSTAVKTKMLNHEVGFNSVTLLRQIVVFNPGTAEQLPFDLFYNIYYKDKVGVRLGAGIFTSNTLTEIEGQNSPRTTTANNLNFRAGVSYNFSHFNRATFNVFADFITKQQLLETSTTSTMQVFPDPITTQTVKSSETIKGTGGQVGVGLKFNLYKHLALYVEVPIMFMRETKVSEDLLQETGVPDEISKSTSSTSGTRIALPTTVYIVLRF